MINTDLVLNACLPLLSSGIKSMKIPVSIKIFLRNCLRSALIKTPLQKVLLPHYPYLFTPAQLSYLCASLDATRDVNGSILEVGCFRGETTIFLATHLKDAGDTRPYIALDTFSGFTKSAIIHEVGSRNKQSSVYSGFQVNDKKWLELALKQNKITFATIIEGDIENVTLDIPGACVSFCLIDVDLYQPVKSALDRIYPLLSPGGMIVVDDCIDGAPFDGALQAYIEFTSQHGLPVIREHGKLGIVIKPDDQ